MRCPNACRSRSASLAGAAKGGLLALSVGARLGVLTELMAEEVDDDVGPKGRHDAERVAVRHGHEEGSVTLGGRRLAVQRSTAAAVAWNRSARRAAPLLRPRVDDVGPLYRNT
jgi:hypothetical protein